MEEKIKLLEQVALEFGLSLQDVVDSWVCQGLVEVPSCKNIIDINKKQPKEGVVNLDFPKNDIRSQAKLFWYAFEGGKFSSDPKTYPNCQGVVGWINPNPNAEEGSKLYVVLPKQVKLRYSDYCIYVGACSNNNGKANTKKQVECGPYHNACYFVAEYVSEYTCNGIKQGEAFCPAPEQLVVVAKKSSGLREALAKIGGTFECNMWTSAEYSTEFAWSVCASSAIKTLTPKDNILSVSCFIAY